MELCTNCKHRSICSALCPLAEEFVNQDYVPQTELLVSSTSLDNIPNTIDLWPDIPEPKPIFTNRERQVLGALAAGHTRDEIAEMLNITRKNLREIIRRIRRKRHKFSL